MRFKTIFDTYEISIHAPSRERLTADYTSAKQSNISIHAPSRERHITSLEKIFKTNFNPRSLAGATKRYPAEVYDKAISIHAPSRERPIDEHIIGDVTTFQSTLPRGSDAGSYLRCLAAIAISIHAPSRERR